MKGEEGDPEHPSTKLTDLRDLIDEEEGEIKFDEIKVREPAMRGSREGAGGPGPPPLKSHKI